LGGGDRRAAEAHHLQPIVPMKRKHAAESSRLGRLGKHAAAPVRPPERPDGGDAFLPDSDGKAEPLRASDAESFAEEFVASALGGESVRTDSGDEVVDDEEGGPFILLDEDGKLPSVPDEKDPDCEGHDSVSRAESMRAARWASRG
jgi:hypothetical protein